MKMALYLGLLLLTAHSAVAEIRFFDNAYPKIWTDVAYLGTTESGYSFGNHGFGLAFDVYRFDEDNISRLGVETIRRILEEGISVEIANRILADYPNAPMNDSELSVYGISADMSKDEYAKTLDMLFRAYYDKQEIVGLSSYAESTEGYNVVAVGGNQILLIDGGISREGGNNLYSCDFNNWDFNKALALNLNDCISTQIQRSYIPPHTFRISASETINNKGISIHRKMNDERGIVLIDPKVGVVDLGSMSFDVGHNLDDIIITSGNDPFVNISGHLYRYHNGGLEVVESFMEGEESGVVPLPSKIFNGAGNKLVFKNNDAPQESFYVCDKHFMEKNTQQTSNKIGCESGSLVEFFGPPGLVSESDSGIVYVHTMLVITDDNDAENPRLYPIRLTHNITNGLIYSPPYEAYKSLERQYPDLMARTLQVAKKNLVADGLEGFLDRFPEAPLNIDDFGFPENITSLAYKSYASSLILGFNPFSSDGYSSIASRSFILQLVAEKSRVYSFAGYLDYEHENSSGHDILEVVVKPATQNIDSYIDPISSIEILTHGEVFAADVRCEIEGPLDITGSVYGSWGGADRFTFPVEWDSKNVQGVASMKGDVPAATGEQQLLVLDVLAELTTGTATVDCEASASDHDGNLLAVDIVPVTIQIDDGIHGGTGIISGHVELPEDIGSEFVTVEININGRSINVQVDESGYFQFENLRDGNFVLNVISDRYVQSCINVTTNGLTTDVGSIELIAGDINNDGEINIADYTLVAGHYGSTKGEENYNPLADLNSDDVINIQDLAILSSHFGSLQCSL